MNKKAKRHSEYHKREMNDFMKKKETTRGSFKMSDIHKKEDSSDSNGPSTKADSCSTLDDRDLDGTNPPMSIHLEWRNVSVSVPCQGENGQTHKKILKNVSGFARPGEVTAIIGPSGAGKSTLLNYLS